MLHRSQSDPTPAQKPPCSLHHTNPTQKQNEPKLNPKLPVVPPRQANHKSHKKKNEKLRPVTMEGQKFKIPQDPCQTLPEPSVAYGPNSVDFVLKFSRVPFRGDLGQHLLEKFSNRSWIRRCMISCPPHFVRRNQRQHREL